MLYSHKLSGPPALNESLQRLVDEGVYELPSSLWAPLGAAVSSETEVLLIALLVLAALDGLPSAVAAFCISAAEVDFLADGCNGSDCDQWFRNPSRFKAMPAGRALAAAFSSALPRNRPGIFEATAATIATLRAEYEKRARQSVYASCPLPPTLLSLVMPPSVAAIRTYLQLCNEMCFEGPEIVHEVAGQLVAATTPNLMELYCRFIFDDTSRSAEAAKPRGQPNQTNEDFFLRDQGGNKPGIAKRVEIIDVATGKVKQHFISVAKCAHYFSISPCHLNRLLNLKEGDNIYRGNVLRFKDDSGGGGGDNTDSSVLSCTPETAEEVTATRTGTQRKGKPLELFDKLTGEAIQEFETGLKCAQVLGISANEVSDVVKGKRAETSTGHCLRFKFQEDGRAKKSSRALLRVGPRKKVPRTLKADAQRPLERPNDNISIVTTRAATALPRVSMLLSEHSAILWQLLCENGLTSADHPCQRYAWHETRDGDTPGSVCQRLSISLTQLVELNKWQFSGLIDSRKGTANMAFEFDAGDRVYYLPDSRALSVLGRVAKELAGTKRFSQAMENVLVEPPAPSATSLASRNGLGSTAVVLLDDDGNVVREYESKAAAGRDLGAVSAIDHFFNGSKPTAHGFRLHLKTGGPYPKCPEGVVTRRYEHRHAVADVRNSKFRGVYIETHNAYGKLNLVAKWVAVVCLNGNSSKLPFQFDDEKAASEAYDKVAIAHGLPTNNPVYNSDGEEVAAGECAGCLHCAVLGENGEGLEKRASKRQKIAPLEFVKGSVNSGSGGGNRSWESSEPKCEFCHGTHDGSYGTGRFCSQNCQYGFIASSRATRKNAKREFKLSLEPTKPSNSSSGGGGGNAERDGGEPWCEHCHGVTHDTQDGSYGTGRFCTQQCRHEEEDEEVEAEGVDEIDFIASILVEDEEAGAEAAHEKHEEEDGDEAEKVDEQEFGATTQTANAKVTEEEIHEKKRDENMDEAEVQAEEEDEDNQVHVAENNQTVAQIAALRGLEVSDLLKINLPSLPGLTKSAKLYPGTHIWLRGPP